MSLLLMFYVKIGTLIHSKKFGFSEVALYLFLPSDFAWNTVVKRGLVHRIVTWIRWFIYRNGYGEVLQLIAWFETFVCSGN